MQIGSPDADRSTEAIDDAPEGLMARVARLEALMAPPASSSDSVEALPEPAVRRLPPALPSPVLRMSLPTYVATALSEAEEALLHREAAAYIGDDDVAREHERRAAGLACVARTRAAEEFEMPYEVEPEAWAEVQSIWFGPPEYTYPDSPLASFRDREVHILRLTGLSTELAANHIDSAMRTAKGLPVLDSEEKVRAALRQSADLSCRVAGTLGEASRSSEARRRRRRTLRRVLLATGGALIAVANPLALPLIGPFAVAASAALGGGAAGAIANTIED